MDNKINFGRVIKDIVVRQNTTVKEESERIGYTLAGLNKIFDKEDVSTSVLKKVCSAYNLKMDYFLKYNNYNSNENQTIFNDSGSVYSRTGSVKTSSIETESLKKEIEALNRENELLKELVQVYKNK